MVKSATLLADHLESTRSAEMFRFPAPGTRVQPDRRMIDLLRQQWKPRLSLKLWAAFDVVTSNVDYGGPGHDPDLLGACWERQDGMARRKRVGYRTFKRRLAELVALGAVAVKHRYKTTALIYPLWPAGSAPPERPKRALDRGPDGRFRATVIGPPESTVRPREDGPADPSGNLRDQPESQQDNHQVQCAASVPERENVNIGAAGETQHPLGGSCWASPSEVVKGAGLCTRAVGRAPPDGRQVEAERLRAALAGQPGGPPPMIAAILLMTDATDARCALRRAEMYFGGPRPKVWMLPARRHVARLESSTRGQETCQ